MKYKAYPEYKYSGVEWIGEIPKEWEVKKLRYLGELDSSGVDKKIREDELLYKSVHYMDVYRNSLKEIGNSDEYLVISADESKMKKCILKKGDVLFTNSSETPEDIGHSTVIKEDLEETLFGYHLMRFRPKYNYCLEYQKYLFGSDFIRGWFERRANGITRYGITYIDFADALVILPPLQDQNKIAKFLDRETVRIASIISAKKKLIEKLKEKRISIISHAVTKGLDPNVKMKSSGIDWIGYIPEGWEVSKVKYYFDSQLGKMLQPNPNDPTESLEKYLCSANITWQGIDTDIIKEMWFNSVEKKKYKVQKGDLLISEGGDAGRSCICDIEFDCYIQNAVHKLNSKDESYNKFMYYWMCFLKSISYIELLCNKATIMHLTQDKLSNLELVVAPLQTQIAIAQFLDAETSRIDSIISKAQDSIEKLKEYQTSLISAAVTGKIDVRGEPHD